MSQTVCGVSCKAGRHGELLLCGFKAGHDGAHAWASLPTFVGGDLAVTEEAVERVCRAFDPAGAKNTVYGSTRWERVRVALSEVLR